MTQNTKTVSDFLAEVSVLNTEILEGELAVRSIIPQRGPLINRRRQLASALFSENCGMIFVPYFEFDPIVDLRKCSALLTALKVEYEKNDTSNERKRAIETNLKFLDARISRIMCTTNEEKEIAKDLLKTVKKLTLTDIVDLNTSINSDSGRTETSSMQKHPSPSVNAVFDYYKSMPSTSQTQTAPQKSFSTTPIVNYAEIQGMQNNVQFNAQPKKRISVLPREIENAMENCHIGYPSTYAEQKQHQYENCSTQYPKFPIHKWKITFTGFNDKHDAFEFLRIVNSKAQSYRTTHEELFASASEFFRGEASKWYFSQTFEDWSDIEARLIADFMQVNYFDDLIDTIRQTKQTNNESIVQFCTKFEDNCSRLRTPLSIEEKIKMLKRNVLEKYHPYIALAQFNDLHALKHALKLLEATMSNSYGYNRNVRFNSNDRSSERQSRSPHRQYNNSNHVSRYDNTNSRDFPNYRSSKDRVNSPYPNNNSQRNGSRNNSSDRNRVNEYRANEKSRDNSRENFRPNSRGNSLTRNGHQNQK